MRNFARIPGGWRLVASWWRLTALVLHHSDRNRVGWRRCRAPGQDGATVVLPRWTVRVLIRLRRWSG